jgi:hypothetical protein
MSDRGIIKLIRKTLTVDTSAYADTDRLGSIITFTGALGGLLGVRNSGLVRSVALILETGTFNGANLHLFRALPTVASADNATLDITDAEMTAKYVGTINIPSTSNTNYEVLSASSVAYATSLGLAVDTTDGHLYGVLQSTGAVTFTAADDLTVILGIEQV